MYSTLDSGDPRQPSGLSRLARRDLPSTPRVPGLAVPADEAVRWPSLTLDATLRWARGGIVWIIVLAVTGAAAGYGYSILAKPKFTASTDLIVDPGNLQLVKTDLYPAAYDQNAQLLDAESKLRVVTSGNVLKRVVEQMNLQNDPEFQQAHSGFDFLSGAAPAATSLDPVETAIDVLDKD
ncbi:MAG TPA: Wzz/FepE/Etk N-terminal domain-containing protein, partial [Devosia sp.]|nr:Wzz/FepE/Etk N-terminal domain-containing protein [Devosia sp.]